MFIRAWHEGARRQLVAGEMAMLILASVAAAAGPAPVASFNLKECHGVSHPDQIVDFDLDEPLDVADCYMVGPDEDEVPFQLIEGGKKLAIRTSKTTTNRFPAVLA